MSVSRVTTWVAGEVLTASALNGEFNNILNNGEDLGWPSTQNKDMDGTLLVLDSDADSTFGAASDDINVLALQGVNLFTWDGTVSSPVAGATFVASATGSPAILRSLSSDSNVGLDFEDNNSNELLELRAVASAINQTRVTNAASGSGPTIAAIGDDTNVPITVAGQGTGHVALGQATSTDVRLAADQPIADSNGNEQVKWSATGSAINELTITNADMGNAPSIGSTGDDTNVDLNITTQGTGRIQHNGVNIAGVGTLQIFSSSDTWSRPSGCKMVLVELWGPGGGGGGAVKTAANSGGAGGGGGGGYVKALLDVSAISSSTITIGTGGTAGTDSGGDGAAGGANSVWSDGSNTLTAGPGSGGSGATGSAGGQSNAGGAGGSASGGDINIAGGVGHPGNSEGTTGNSYATGGPGGGSFSTPSQGAPIDGAGNAGIAPGGGGSGGAAPAGGSSDRTGGAGADGACYVWEFY